jgi:hypothetical protein
MNTPFFRRLHKSIFSCRQSRLLQIRLKSSACAKLCKSGRLTGANCTMCKTFHNNGPKATKHYTATISGFELPAVSLDVPICPNGSEFLVNAQWPSSIKDLCCFSLLRLDGKANLA